MPPHVHGPVVKCSPKFLEVVRIVQKMRDSDTLKTSYRAKCLTPDVKDPILRKPSKQYRASERLAVGGMSRLYLNETRNAVIKITDTKKSWGKHEQLGYELLWKHGVPTARILEVVPPTTEGHQIFVMERLLCTATSALLAATTQQGFEQYFSKIISAIDKLLSLLSRERLSIVDFSTDNIMCRVHGDHTLEFVLVDPQFTVPMEDLGKAVGTVFAENIDRLHLCMKFVGTWKNDKYAKLLCQELLGFQPVARDIVQILVYRLPIILRAAYTIMQRLELKKNPGKSHDEEVGRPTQELQ